MRGEFENQVAVVTGGNRGIGKAVAWELAREGADAALVARDRVALQAAADEISRGTERRILPFQIDLTDNEQIRRGVQAIGEACGRIDILVNGAAPVGRGTELRSSTESEEEVLEEFTVKTVGYLRMTRAVVPYMKRQGSGRIVNLGGLAAVTAGRLSATIRNVSVTALTKTLGNELGPFGITVNAIHPGIVATERFAERFAEIARRQGRTIEEHQQQLAEATAIRRMVTPQDIAHVVAFLASPRAAAICGETIVVNGGAGSTIRY
ncbi:MAG: SDR family oxidoreductase [Chloroflexi bacterium]|nr:SDR family oxidoreductase [Chloroflexota bacterium]